MIPIEHIDSPSILSPEQTERPDTGPPSFTAQNRWKPSWLQVGGVWLLPLALWGLWAFSNPFQAEWVRQTVSFQSLSPAQRSNIQQAARALDGVVLEPGEAFSFNRVVGPRTERRGYRVAPSYLEGETPQTPGGGICLLSSLLYQAALATGLTIQERVPHLQTIRTVPPGLDATVWYGQADLKFQNPFNQSVQLRTQVSPASLTVSLHGRSAQPMLPVRREVTQQTGGAVQVRVFQTLNGKERLISSDLYRITPR